ncbi:MAG: hypothetical protein HQ476_02535 [SAR202 cluster bacterium]|nr:hypothetical protein [SAR202 cluster bacterium]
MNKFKKLIALAGVGLVLVLTACSGQSSAASIGDTEVPLSTVQDTINEILKERNKVETEDLTLAAGVELNTNAIRFHVISVIFDDIAEKIEMTVTDAELAARREDIISQIGSEDGLAFALVGAQIAPQDFERYIRTVLLAEKIGAALESQGETAADGSGIQNLIIAMGKEQKVDINPRYGSWDYETGNITPPADNEAIQK